MQRNNSNSEPTGLMGFGLNFESSSSRHQTPKKGRDTAFPAQARPILDNQNKLKGLKCVVQSRSNPPHRSSECGNGGILAHPKMAGARQVQSSRARDKKDDELVKYMSNLPAYLQRLEREENLQDKALNVGVLDWTRLEQWKGKQVTAGVGGKAPLDGNNLSAKPSASSKFSDATGGEEHPSISSNPVASCSDGIPRSSKLRARNVIRFQDIETASKSSFDGHKSLTCTYRSFGQNNEESVLENGERKNSKQRIASKVDNQSSNSRNYGALVTPRQNASACGGKSSSSLEEMQLLQKEIRDQKINSSMGTATSKLRKQVASLHSKEGKSNGSLGTKKRTEGLQESSVLSHQPQTGEKKNTVSSKLRKQVASLHSKEVKSNGSLETKKRTEGLQESSVLSHQPQTGEKKNIVLLVPKKFAKYRVPNEQRTPVVQNYMKADKNSLSHSVSHDDHSAELHSEIPRSCPLPSEARINAEPCKTAHIMINTQGEERISDASHSSVCSSKTQVMLSGRDYAEKSHTVSDGDALETMKKLDQETAELAARKGRLPSPNRRFSFSLSRLSRSFSFKESSAIPLFSSEYVSVKSGPVMTDASSCLDNSNREKASGHNRARSSPLRRILEPLLKPKSTVPPCSAETPPSLKGSLNSPSLKPTKVMESYPTEKHGTANMQALLQVTIKNGIPLFRFVVNNNSSVLAATTNNVTSSGKHESENNYTFYSIDEIKKKGGSWRHQGSRVKHCGYVYNVIGQMKVNSSCFLDATERNSISEYTVKESVLCGVELRQVEQASPKFVSNSELAAIVVKVPRQSLILEMLKSDKVKDSMEEGFSESSPADKCSCNVRVNERQLSLTAILPGAVHSLPNKGGPSPLIHRWKSGGSCDCGGWDVGCKLHVLSNENKCCKIRRNSSACLTSDHLELFNQNEALQDKPVFSLAPNEKGMYSVEFSQTISILQAFFISVTVISCQKSPDLAEMGILSEDIVSQETKNANDETKKTPSVEAKTSLKYTPNPPLSPVGRV